MRASKLNELDGKQTQSFIVNMDFTVLALVLFMIFYPSISTFMSGVGAGLFSGLN